MTESERIHVILTQHGFDMERDAREFVDCVSEFLRSATMCHVAQPV